jgi:RNA polymerase sigma-70 factor (ECF subfamily)
LPGEAALIARLRAGDLDALGELYAWLGRPMTTLARSMMRERAEAEDVVEEALMRIHRAAPGFRGERGLRTWTLRIVANLCRDRLRRRRRFPSSPPEELSPLDAAGLALDPVEGWDDTLDRAQVMAVVETALGQLPEEQREVVIMRHRLGLSTEEVAEALGVPEGTVKSRLSRALEALRRRLEGTG